MTAKIDPALGLPDSRPDSSPTARDKAVKGADGSTGNVPPASKKPSS